MLAVKIA